MKLLVTANLGGFPIDPGTESDGGAKGVFIIPDFILQLEQTKKQRLGTRRTTRNIHVNRQGLINTLNNTVGVENSTRTGTGAHGDNPFRFRHLLIDSHDNRQHLFGYGSRNNNAVRLTG